MNAPPVVLFSTPTPTACMSKDLPSLTMYAHLLYNRRIMKRTSLFLSEKQLSQLRALAQETGLPIAELVRRALDEYIERQKAKGSQKTS